MKPHFRLTVPEDASYLTRWLQEPGVLRWFPMMNQVEIDDAVRIWMNYAKLQAALTAEIDNVSCGMANLYLQPYKKFAHQCLFAIIVDEKFRGKGVGKALLEQLMKHAKDKFSIEILHLEVYDGNPAIHLYERLGFARYGAQNSFIKEDGTYTAKILMQKYL